MSSKPFKFKQFAIAQDRCAMKIGTDGVLLGAWTSVEGYPDGILDIGTGTGVIALMLAQRSDAMTIDAVELDDNAYEQATENFENSGWGDRLYCYHAHLYEFAAEVDDVYDIIVCNPPFFETPSLPTASLSQGEKIPSKSRQMARFEESMPFELLVGAVAKLLSSQGRFSAVIPFDREDDFILLCSKVNLFLDRITRVKGTSSAEVKRSLMEFSFRDSDSHPDELVVTELTIEKARHDYTEDYISLVKDFYLKM